MNLYFVNNISYVVARSIETAVRTYETTLKRKATKVELKHEKIIKKLPDCLSSRGRLDAPERVEGLCGCHMMGCRTDTTYP